MSDEKVESPYGSIDTSGLSKQMWLVLIPTKLSDAWANVPEGTTLGTLTFTRGSACNANPVIKQSLIASVAPEFTSSKPDLPLDYSIEAMVKKVPTLHPFSRAADGSVKIEGKVSRTCNLQMLRSEKYRAFCKNRLLSNVTSNRVVRSLETRDRNIGRANIRPPTGGEGFGDAIMKHGKTMLEFNERSSEDRGKRRKFEGQSTRSVVFELYEQQRFWTVKELRSVSGRLEKELRPVLSELCEFRRSGEQKGTWELKKEFRMQECA